ncbi:MAG: protein phosphatase CheZ [Nitrospiraceae bacterium]
MSDQNRKLYEELGTLARYIENTRSGFQNAQQPLEAASTQLPQAAAHLSDLRQLSEDATHKVMTQTEALEENAGKMGRTVKSVLTKLEQAGLTGPLVDELRTLQTVLTDDEARRIEIFTALTFQDLLAQRINKLATVLTEVEHKLLELLVIFGSGSNGTAKVDEGKTGEMLKWLEASKTTALKQDLVDDVLNQLGFG